jgi:hypothetical protein
LQEHFYRIYPEGTATETAEYVVSSKTISIPAGQSSGYLTVSTKI